MLVGKGALSKGTPQQLHVRLTYTDPERPEQRMHEAENKDSPNPRQDRREGEGKIRGRTEGTPTIRDRGPTKTLFSCEEESD